ncbi:protein sprint-like [Panonychus citri]|uniref:protein sprint-like n=1 Tax=Panonychus citri TaxID=50023 RepID=UPI002307214C|nr:protein sprint-like [Panonychus citri]
MSLVSPESSPSLPSKPVVTPLQSANCQLNQTNNCIKPSVSSAFSIVPSSSISLSSSLSLTNPTEAQTTTVNTERRHSDAGFVFSSLIGKDSTDSTESQFKLTTSNTITSNSGTGGGGTGEGKTVNGNELNSNEITLIDRLTKTTSIWFLPDTGRSCVTNLLERKENGCFIVRNSSKYNSMALSVRLPEGKGPHVEHYLVETSPNGLFHLEGSENYFTSMTSLISHYSNCCDELPVRLTLPNKLMNANFVKLTSYSLLGQEFWHTLNQTPKRAFAPIIRSASNASSTNNKHKFTNNNNNNNNLSLTLSLSIKQLATDATEKPAIEVSIQSPDQGSYRSNKSNNLSGRRRQVPNLSLTTNNLNQQQAYIVNELTSSGSSTNITCLPSSSSSSTSSCSPPSTSPSRIDTDELMIDYNNDPLVDMKKSSTVPINLVEQCESSVKISVPPKPPPRSSITPSGEGNMQISIAPPVPSRTCKPSSKANSKSFSSSTINSFIKSISIEDIFSNKNQSNASDDELLIVKEEEIDDEDDETIDDNNYSSNNNNNNNRSKNRNNNINMRNHTNNYKDNNLSISQRNPENGSSHNISSQSENTKPNETMNNEKSPRGIETLIKYYNSKVEDKYSDYEDIWSFTPKPFEDRNKLSQQQHQQAEKKEKESPKVTKSSQSSSETHQQIKKHKPSIIASNSRIKSTPSSCSSHGFKKSIITSNSKCCSASTQTDPMKSSSCHNDDQFNEIINRFEHHSHYGSDSNLTLSSIRSTHSKHNLSLESLIYLNKDALSIYGEASDLGFPLSGGSNEVNPQLEDACTQIGNSKANNSSSSTSQQKRPHQSGGNKGSDQWTKGKLGGTRGKDGAWLVDSSWKWRRSNNYLDQSDTISVTCSNADDTDDTTLTLRSPLRRNKRSNNSSSDDKRTLDQERADLIRYRRFSARYVLESGVESDPETADEAGTSFEKSNRKGDERKSRTVEDLIALEAPELKVPKIEIDTNINVNLDDSYDNVVTLRKHDRDAATRKANREDSSKTSGGTMTDTETVFNEPWDSEYWRKLISVTPGKSEIQTSLSPEEEDNEEDESVSIYDDPNGASSSALASKFIGSSSLSLITDDNDKSTLLNESNSNKSKVKKETSCKQRIDNLVERLSSFSGKYNNDNVLSGNSVNQQQQQQHQHHHSSSTILSQNELGHHHHSSERESIDITEITSFTSEAVSDLLSSISMHDEAIITMESNSSTLKSQTVTTTTSSTSHRNERIYSAGKSICDYIFKLTEEGDNTFAKSVSHFIDCTKDLTQVNPHVVMRNIRQFMNGMKNYLVKHGEKNFLEMIREERNKLKSDEFLNIDAIIEGTLHKLIIKPLKSHLDGLFVEYYKTNGSLSLLSENMKNAQKKSPTEIGVRSDLYLPDSKSMAIIQRQFNSMQRAYSPLKKLEHLLAAISSIYSGVKISTQQAVNNSSESMSSRGGGGGGSGVTNNNRKAEGSHLSIGADDFLPIFIYVLVHCGFLSAEIEAEFMWGLLHPSLLSGEGGYYLTTLSSCLHVIKNMSETEMTLIDQQNLSTTTDEHNLTASTSLLSSSIASISPSPPATPSIMGIATGTSSSSSLVTSMTPSRLASVTDLQGYMKIMIPNELSCSIVTKTLPVRPSMTTKDVCKMIAHKFNQTNSEDYGLFQITGDGSETQLEPNDLPQAIKSETIKSGKLSTFAYKRIDVKFIWPKMDDQ